MREMVLNHASIQASDRYSAVDWLKDVTSGMSLLILHKVTESTLRMSRPLHEIHCMPALPLWDALLELRKIGALEEYLFLVRLSTKVPLLSDVDQDVVNRFLGCEAAALPLEDGAPLVLCAITDGIAVGFPSAGWDRDQLTVRFNELSDDDILLEASETIDNLTRAAHARPISVRHRANLPLCKNFAELWETREERYPNLKFGLDVGHHFTEWGDRDLLTIDNRLKSLDEAAAKWRIVGGPAPPWRSKVTPEKPREEHIFRSHDDTRKPFVWHARFGSQGRIHLRFDRGTYEVEIGYVGKKLGT